MTHDAAMNVIRGAACETALSYEEAVAVYLRLRGILDDGRECKGDPVPADWQPNKQRDTYGVALMMIRHGAEDPKAFAAETLSKFGL